MKRESAEAIFQLAGFTVTHVWELANLYWGGTELIARHHDGNPPTGPWWLLMTELGPIRIGWRKRVIAIDWKAMPTGALVTKDDVTKGDDHVHAYSEAKAIEYLRALREASGRRCHACDQVRADVGELPDKLPLCAQCAKAHRMGYRCGEEAQALTESRGPFKTGTSEESGGCRVVKGLDVHEGQWRVLGPWRNDESRVSEDARRIVDGKPTAPVSDAWQDQDDKPLPEDAAIHAAFPTRSGRHDLYKEAMRLVGAKYSKGALVALVNWLLHRATASGVKAP